MHNKTLLGLVPAALLAISCEKAPAESGKIPISITTSVTKVTDTAYETGDAVGLYVASHPASLRQSGNHADNVKFTFNGAGWVADNRLYWQDDKTAADFHIYFPYSASASVDSHSFSVQLDQSTEAGYKASEFLVGSSLGIAPTPDPVMISTRHIMSCIEVELKAGSGWTDSEIATASVSITGLQTSAKINLSDGSISASGNAADIRPLSLGGGRYKAIAVPQEVQDADLVRIKIGNNIYTLNTSVNLTSGKRHKCGITVSRTGEGINIGIDPWENGDEFNGTVE